MTAPLKTVEADTAAVMPEIGQRARKAARVLALAPTAQKDKALAAIAETIRARKADILAANAEDMAEAKRGGANAAFLDRLALDDKRVAAMAEGVDVVRELADPVGEVTESWTRPNGMTIERVRVPLGVIGIIYESRPNVTADAAALCLKAGNAAILRGGSESQRSNRAIHALIADGLRAAGLPADAIQLVPTRDRAAVGMMLAGLDGDYRCDRAARRQEPGRARAGRRRGCRCSRISKASATSMSTRPPSLDMAKSIVLNAKMRRTGVCGAAETLLVDRAVAPTHLKPLVTMLLDAGCEVRGDDATRKADARVKPASEEDWSTEYLDFDHLRDASSTASTTPSRISSATARITPIRSSPTIRPRRRNSCARSIPPSCCTTRRPSSPTAASSASAPRSASPPDASTRAARSAPSSSPASTTASAARGRSRP